MRIRFVLNFRLRFCKSASRGQPSWGGILPSRIGPRGSAWQRARTEGELETWSQRLGRWPAPEPPAHPAKRLGPPTRARSAGELLHLHGGTWRGAQAGGGPGFRGSACQGPTAGGHALVCVFVLV